MRVDVEGVETREDRRSPDSESGGERGAVAVERRERRRREVRR